MVDIRHPTLVADATGDVVGDLVGVVVRIQLGFARRAPGLGHQAPGGERCSKEHGGPRPGSRSFHSHMRSGQGHGSKREIPWRESS